MTGAAIEIERLRYAVGGTEILRDVTCRIGGGEYWSVIGPNGAGKTTLLKCLERIITTCSGEIRINGRALSTFSQKELAKQLSYVPQADDRQFPFTVREFVMMGRYPHLSPFSTIRPQDEEIVREVLVTTGTEMFAPRQLRTLSGGERQQVYIAAALAQGARILLLDEPTTFLDYRHQAEVMHLLRRLNSESAITILAVTHDLNSAVRAGGHVLALKRGSVAFQGPVGDVLNERTLAEIYDAEFRFIRDRDTGALMVTPRGVVE